jgi:uncharacterized OB-fold protein
MPVCPNCGSQQPDGAAFCDDCGAKLEKVAPAAALSAAAPALPTPTAVATTCPVCGTPVTPGEAFCDNCGAALGPAVVPTPATAAALACSACGAQLEPGSNFCDMCGAPVSDRMPPPLPEQPPPAAPAPPPAHLPGTTLQRRLVVQGTNATLPFPPGKTEVLIGREDPVSGVFPDVDLTDHGADEGGVSRRHARAFLQGNQVFIEDLNSTNYTYVNQQRLTPGQPHPLNNGDEVCFGRVKLTFYST